MNQRGLVSLPRNWRVITVASLTTIGLAYGAGQSVRGEWWPRPKAKPAAATAPATTPASTANGFSSTIHRLMSDARVYADKGELDKAVQLADRAAKISEASSQLLGPSTAYSPEQTAQFANDLRARRDAVARRTVPTPVAPTMAAAAPQPQPATLRSREIPTESPPQFFEPLVAERPVAARVIAARVATASPAEFAAESRDSKLAWAEELPPTPAPEPVSLNKPIKFRRSVLARAEHSIDEAANGSRTISDDSAVPSSADAVIAEMLDVEFTNGLPIESPPTVPEAVTTPAGASLNEPPNVPQSAPPVEAASHSLPGEIQPVGAETFAEETPSSPNAPGPNTAWEYEAFAEELRLGKQSEAKPKGSSTEPTFDSTRADTPPIPEVSFQRQRVVQLRRRLEKAASLNPGGAYTVSGSPTTESAQPVRPAPAAKAETPDPAPQVRSIESSEPIDGWMSSTDSPKSSARPTFVPVQRTESSEQQTVIPEQQAVTQSEPIPKERQVVRLREHRVLPDHVRAALLQAAALPSQPAPRRHIVGYSEPMLWQSASEPDSVLPMLSLARGVGNGTSGSHNSTAASLPPDLRDLAHTARQTDETAHGHQRVIPAVTVELTGFRSNELPVDSIQLTEPSGPANSSPQDRLADRTPADSWHSPDSHDSLLKSAKRPPAAARQKPADSKSKASHEVARQSFAVIEPLAAALQLPLATTASLLGGAGLALLGLGLLLVRAAIRWRHS